MCPHTTIYVSREAGSRGVLYVCPHTTAYVIRMLTYAYVCSCMLTYASIDVQCVSSYYCIRQTYSDVCSRMLSIRQTYAHVCSRMLAYAHVCSRMLV